MAQQPTVVLSNLTVEDWLESYRQASAPAMDAEGPLNPNAPEPVVRSVVPGPYPDWHYQALAMHRLLETVVKQEKRIKDLEGRVQDLERTV